MRIAFTIFKFFPHGGIQRDLMKILQEVQRRGHEATVYTLRWQAPWPEDFRVVELPIVGFYRHVQYDHFAEAVLAEVRQSEFDLVVGFNKMAGLDVYYAGDSCFIEKALSQRNAWYRLLPRFKSFYAAERAVFDARSGTEILTISNVEVPRYRHHYRTPPERFHALPPGIERDRIAPDNRLEIRSSLRCELGRSEDDWLILFVGSGYKKKGLDRALIAVAALPAPIREKTYFYVIGNDRAEGFERMAMRLGIADKVTFFAEGRDDVPAFLFACDALLHPAYDETAGMVILEAMLAGLPALVTKNCGYATYLLNYDAGIVLTQPTQEALNAGLVQLMTSDKRATWSGNGRAAKDDPMLFRLAPSMLDYLEKVQANKKPLLVFSLFRYFDYGGLQRDFLKIALACQAAGYDIYVYCLAWFGDVPHGFTVETVEVKGVLNYVRYQQFGEYVSEAVRWRRPVAHVGFNKIPGLDIYYAADSCFEYKAQMMRTPVYRLTRRYKQMSGFERLVFDKEQETEVLLLTEVQKEQFQKYYDTPDRRFHLLPPGVSRDRMRGPEWQAQRTRVRKEFELSDDEFLMILVGSGFITKGLDRVIESLASLPASLRVKTRLLVIGQDNPQAFLRQARRLGVEAQLLVQRGRDDIPDVLQAADLMVHPAYMESGGLVLIEAVVAGLPVIATAACGFAPYILRANAGVVLEEPFDQDALNSWVEKALKDVGQRELWSDNGVAFGQSSAELFNMPEFTLGLIQSFHKHQGAIAP
jgi:UDP-glucose:(heptosyl)LPS alpha-1,3-glucosyltransferase